MEYPSTQRPVPPVTLRRLTSEDADEYFDLFDSNRPHFRQHDTDFADGMTLGHVQQMLSEVSAKSAHHFGIIKDDELIGATLLKLRRRDNEAELAYWVERGHIRKGIATEACRQTINYGFRETGTRFIDALIKPTNIASIKTVQRLGFQKMMTLEQGVVYSLDARGFGTSIANELDD